MFTASEQRHSDACWDTNLGKAAYKGDARRRWRRRWHDRRLLCCTPHRLVAEQRADGDAIHWLIDKAKRRARNTCAGVHRLRVRLLASRRRPRRVHNRPLRHETTASGAAAAAAAVAAASAAELRRRRRHATRSRRSCSCGKQRAARVRVNRARRKIGESGDGASAIEGEQKSDAHAQVERCRQRQRDTMQRQ